VSWGGSLPRLPDSLDDRVSAAWGLTIVHDNAAAAPLSLPAFAALFAQSRADQVLRAFSGRTNLVLSGSTTVVVGAGILADALTTTLTRIGSRVVRVVDNPVERLRAHIAGLETASLDEVTAVTARAHYLLTTGESHTPIDPRGLGAVVADASVGAAALRAIGGASVRRHVRRADEGDTRIVEMPAVFPDHDEASGDLSWRLADLLIALSLSAAETGDLAAADECLAREAIA